MKTFEELLEGLSKNDVLYILVGGLAVDICGFSRVTLDMDILIERSDKNIKRLLHCLLSFGKGAAKELTIEDFTLEEGAIRVVEEFPVDIFTIMRGDTYEDLLPYSNLMTTEKGISIRYLNAEGLIRLKEGSLRLKDQLDVAALKKIQEE
ncbi:MAG: hypothetical protein AAB317_01385 [Nitrospirota bacterium]